MPSRFFAWSDAFDLGIPSLDADHQGFLERMDGLSSALDRGEGAHRTQATLVALRAYATYHFMREEELMGAAGYPGLNAQQVEHASYLYYLEKLAALPEADRALGRETMAFMRTWFVDHILGTDRRFSQWLTATDRFEWVALAAECGPAAPVLRCLP